MRHLHPAKVARAYGSTNGRVLGSVWDDADIRMGAEPVMLLEDADTQ
jgi:hypothetical protein